MKLTISKQGVSFELEGEEILKALFSENNTALYKLKLALDKLEAEELREPSEEDIRNIPFFSEAEINQMLSQETSSAPLLFEQPKKRPFSLESDIKFTPTDEKSFDGGKKTFFEHDEKGHFNFPVEPVLSDAEIMENNLLLGEKQQSDTEVPLPQKEPVKSIEIKPKRKYHRRHKHNQKRKKPVRKYSVAPEEEKVNFVKNKSKPVMNYEDDPIIKPAKRPKTNSIEVNV